MMIRDVKLDALLAGSNRLFEHGYLHVLLLGSSYTDVSCFLSDPGVTDFERWWLWIWQYSRVLLLEIFRFIVVGPRIRTPFTGLWHQSSSGSIARWSTVSNAIHDRQSLNTAAWQFHWVCGVSYRQRSCAVLRTRLVMRGDSDYPKWVILSNPYVSIYSSNYVVVVVE